MTIELVDGKAGVAHISSEDKAIIHQAKFSKSDVVFDWGDAFKCSMSSPNWSFSMLISGIIAASAPDAIALFNAK